MARLKERMQDGNLYCRRKATEDTKRKIRGWETWECSDPEFSYDYDKTVSLYVHAGIAELVFTNGEKN